MATGNRALLLIYSTYMTTCANQLGPLRPIIALPRKQLACQTIHFETMQAIHFDRVRPFHFEIEQTMRSDRVRPFHFEMMQAVRSDRPSQTTPLRDDASRDSRPNGSIMHRIMASSTSNFRLGQY